MTFVYDAENKQVEVKNTSSVTIGQYWYDGDGKRVKKYVPGTGETTIFVYDASGKPVAEYSTNLNPAPQVSYLTNDHLGSPRINTDENGGVISRHDYHPFGEEIAGGSRTADLGYVADDNRKQFTGYERDDETGLDFAQARMFESTFGRFTTPDDFFRDTSPGDPSSWNLYVYTRNNPLRFVDPSGGKAEVTVDEKNKTVKIVASFAVYGADGQGITKKELKNQRDLIKSQIKAAYQGKWKLTDGTEFKISIEITVETAESETDAIKKVSNDVAGNIVEVGNQTLVDTKGTHKEASSFRNDGENFDRMMVSIADDRVKKRNVYAHEFTHLLGSNAHSKDDGDVYGNGQGPDGVIPSQITQRDMYQLFYIQMFDGDKKQIRRAPEIPKGSRIWKKP